MAATLTDHTMNGKPVYTVPAKSVLNMESGFRHKLLCDGPTFTAGSACTYSCSFCLHPDTLIQMADGTTKTIGAIEIGDHVIGVDRQRVRLGHSGTLVVATVLATTRIFADAFRIRLDDGRTVVCSSGHRWLTERGWKCTHKLTRNNRISTFNMPIETPSLSDDYRRGYLAGIIRGDGTLKRYDYSGRYRRHTSRSPQKKDILYQFRLAMKDGVAIDRAASFLARFGVRTTRFEFKQTGGTVPTIPAIRTSSKAAHDAISQIISSIDSYDWHRGFLAGIFDAEGSFSSAIRIHNTNKHLLLDVERSLSELKFRFVRDEPTPTHRCGAVRIRGGLAEEAKFFNICAPAITRKFRVAGRTLRSSRNGQNKIAAIERLHGVVELIDISTSTENFIANGMISHNCYVEDLMRKSPHMRGIDRPHEEVVVRREGAIDALRKQLTFANGTPRYPDPGDNRVLYMSPLVDVAGNVTLRDETIEACRLILALTRWHIRILSKSNMLPSIAEALIPDGSRERMIFGVSAGTLNDDEAKSFEIGTALVSKRLASLYYLQNKGFRTFGMICPSLPKADADGYTSFAREMYEAIRADRCEHVWAEVMNVRGESLTKTVRALDSAGFRGSAWMLHDVSRDQAQWEEYARATFSAHAPLYRPGQLRFLQYVNKANKEWWTSRVVDGAVLL